MNKELRKIINDFSEDETSLNKIIVSLFLKSNSIRTKNNILIKSLLVSEKSKLFDIISALNFSFTFDDVIEAFELAIPSGQKVINGAVYTPNYIKSFIIDSSLIKIQKSYDVVLAADISCGCGGFLFNFAERIKLETKKSFSKIFSDNIFGLDISSSSIIRTKILLSLLAIFNGEDENSFDFNLYTGNALSFDWESEKKVKLNGGFDIIVGNPPYVRAKNIDDISKSLLSNWDVTKAGNPDLYIPFFEIGLKNINESGVLGYITLNTFYKSVNARELRKFLQEKKYELSIIDFGNEKIFYGKSAYTCICLISKNTSQTIRFKKETSTSLLKNGLELFSKISYNALDYKKGWLLNDKKVVKNIKQIEGTGMPLGEKYRIRNGIATLSNDTYIFKPLTETDQYYTLFQHGQFFEIEKAICRDIIKPNILKYEHEIEGLKEKLIYPYMNSNSPLKLMEERFLKSSFPKAYKYLLNNKETLSKRDKGEGEYSKWYAFGRNQALNDKGFKLMFPYMSKTPHFVFTDNEEMLIYCGYAVFNESAIELKILKRILESKVFDYYVKNTSKPYSAGYFSYAKNYVRNFGICELTEKEKYFLGNGVSNNEVDEFLIDKYGISI